MSAAEALKVARAAGMKLGVDGNANSAPFRARGGVKSGESA
jgi:hypothetical protein